MKKFAEFVNDTRDRIGSELGELIQNVSNATNPDTYNRNEDTVTTDVIGQTDYQASQQVDEIKPDGTCAKASTECCQAFDDAMALAAALTAEDARDFLSKGPRACRDKATAQIVEIGMLSDEEALKRARRALLKPVLDGYADKMIADAITKAACSG